MLELQTLVAWAATVLFAVDPATVRRVSNRAVDTGLVDLSRDRSYTWFILTVNYGIADPP